MIKILRRLTAFVLSVVNVTLPASYQAGGMAISPASLGLEVVDLVLASPTGGYFFEFDHATGKLKVFQPTNLALAGAAGVAGADNTIVKASDTAIGVSGAGTAAAVKSTAVEVAAGTDLSGVTVRIIGVGY